MSKSVLKFENVCWKYSDTKENALENINIDIKKGELIGIIGPNASGKSSLCRLCNGLIPNSFTGSLSGRVTAMGEDITKTETAKLAEKIGSVFSDPEAQLSQITVYEEIAFGSMNLGISREKIIKRVDKALQLLNLEPMKNRSPFQLSGGEQQRVAIASVIAMQPEILVLDEPTSNLDPISTENIFKTIEKLNKEENITVLLVEHEIELLAKYATRIVVIYEGKSILDGTPKEVFQRTDIFEKIGMHIPQVAEVAKELDITYRCWPEKSYPLTLEEGLAVLNR